MMSLMRSIAILLSALATIAAQTAGPLIDNDQLRATLATATPHKKTDVHDHKLNRVMIYLDAGHQNIDFQDGKKTVLDWKPGDVRWSPANGMHVGLLTTDKPSRTIEVEVKKPGTAIKSADVKLDPLKVDPKHYKLEFENDQVRVFRVKIGPHESTPVHEHARNRVVVYLTDQNFRVTPVGGQPEIQQHKAGSASWGVPVTHKEENLGDKLFEVVVVEAKS